MSSGTAAVALKLKEWPPLRLEEGGRETLAAADASQPASQSVSVSHMHVHGRHSLVQMAVVVDGHTKKMMMALWGRDQSARMNLAVAIRSERQTHGPAHQGNLSPVRP